MPVAIRVLTHFERVSRDLVDRFKAIPTANVSDNMLRITAAGSKIRPFHAKGVLAGPAFTVKGRPGDNLILHKALDLAEPGDVVVMDAGGDLTNSLFGEMMAALAKARHLAGVVINGAIRDYASIHQGDFPVFAAGVTHRGPYKDGPGEINVPIAIEGMVIEPGDLILGDEDGLVCVPRAIAEDVYAASKAKHESEEKQLQEYMNQQSDRSWVDERFKELGYVFVD
ncbi:RraA family protein [Paralcaligenes ureilyticus]|uniref:Putative 4-hydroxy-4-methyl-2-oxoglutarate aldolase n=1 Tax=Paralcaligenes ureilyticus TaxID=627131 RepID=A0A4R3LZX3_9BURK|nr:RraA family protein [Paralcaligenes ureilyticus]TCT06334.1 RraA family protein [Paralcaligenes ureilyticus]